MTESEHHAYQINCQRFLLTWPQISLEGDFGMGSDFNSQNQVILNELKELINTAMHGLLIYAICCIEPHEDGSPHCHAYVVCSTRPRITNTILEFHNRIPNVTTVGRRDIDHINSRDYCKKYGTWIEWGQDPIKEKKIKFDEKKKLIMTTNEKDWILNHAQSRSDVKLWREVRLPCEEPYEGPRKLHWFFGKTGTGKTTKAHELAKSSGLRWSEVVYVNSFFNGYTDEEFVIFDDIRSGTIPYHILLKLLDRWGYKVNVKNAVANWQAKEIVITTPISPVDMYRDHEGNHWDNLDQLIRRLQEFGEIVEFLAGGETRQHKYDLETFEEVEL